MDTRTRQSERENKTRSVPRLSHTHGEEAGAIAGEIVGGIVGAAAGLPGAIAGMVIGGATGALAGKVLDSEAERTHVHDEELDKEIGVSGGDLGGQPRPRTHTG
jgi:uncharacterized membrane protein